MRVTSARNGGVTTGGGTRRAASQGAIHEVAGGARRRRASLNGVGEEHSGEPEGGEAFCHLWNLERPVGTGEREEEGAGGVSVRWGAVRWVAAVPGVGGGGLVGERATGGETSRSISDPSGGIFSLDVISEG